MPEHVHLGVLPTDGVLIRTILAEVKYAVTRQALNFVDTNCPSFIERMAGRQPNGKVEHRL